jgi:hypothetical protein
MSLLVSHYRGLAAKVYRFPRLVTYPKNVDGVGFFVYLIVNPICVDLETIPRTQRIWIKRLTLPFAARLGCRLVLQSARHGEAYSGFDRTSKELQVTIRLPIEPHFIACHARIIAAACLVPRVRSSS